MPSGSTEKRLTIQRAGPVRIGAKDIAAALEAMPCRMPGHGHAFTSEEDAWLLKYRPIRTWGQLCDAFGLSEHTLHRRYRALTEGKEK
jgi:hypothetical protein